MQVFEILNTDVEPLRVADTAAEAIRTLDEYEIQIIPIVDHTTRKLIGMITKDRIIQNPEALPGSLVSTDENVICLDPEAHLYDAARVMNDANAKLLPVVDQKKNFLGVVTRSELLTALSEMNNVNELGTVLTIELDKRDFMLTEIVRITENEGAKILSIGVEAPDENNQNFRISLKLNLIDVSRVTAALNRYGYLITQETTKAEEEEDFNMRADEFLKYLNL